MRGRGAADDLEGVEVRGARRDVGRGELDRAPGELGRVEDPFCGRLRGAGALPCAGVGRFGRG